MSFDLHLSYVSSLSGSEVGSVSTSSSIDRKKEAIERISERLAALSERLAMDLPAEELAAVREQYEQLSKNLEMVLSTYRWLTKKPKTTMVSTTVPISRTMVLPGDLPLFQWFANVIDSKKTVFETVEECLDRFEDVVQSYRQSMDDNWHLLLPRMLSPEQRSWFDAHLRPHPERPWSIARKVIMKKYGINDAERQAQRSKDLVNLTMSKDESVDRYTDKFHRIRREAGWENDRKSAAIYINSFIPELTQHVWLAQVNMPSEQRSNVDHACSLYGKVVLSRHSYEPRNVVVSGLSVARPGVVVASLSSSSGPSRSSGVNGKQHESVRKYCRMHVH
ncbi:hypothetical protein EC973_006712 [Apophysomyces ossiformis]|uniref:Retrotransposon gag domain-containing protein n=1 Tax=Apophysomyces ossiformis TaxID=679940 RepID=A0A8H7EUI1_9FUNG|nr:hypothetical protein EC973_006712 [Apophysomyces ossiformis]